LCDVRESFEDTDLCRAPSIDRDAFVAHRGEIAELSADFRNRIIPRPSSCDELFDTLVDMEAQFLVDVTRCARTGQGETKDPAEYPRALGIAVSTHGRWLDGRYLRTLGKTPIPAKWLDRGLSPPDET